MLAGVLGHVGCVGGYEVVSCGGSLAQGRADVLQALALLSTSPSLHSQKFGIDQMLPSKQRANLEGSQPWSLGRCLYYSSTFGHCLRQKSDMDVVKGVKRNKIAFNVQKICYTYHLIFS